MPWPLSQDYNEAIQSPATSFGDPELKQGEAVTNALGIPMPRSGNFADVYEFITPPRKWAVKCFTRQIPGLRERYKEISAYLKQMPLPFMVEFSYLEQGIRVRGEWYPILKMHWVEGFTLNEFVRNNLDKPQMLDMLGQIWVRLAAKLREAEMAHCDLQHGNVLLVPGSKAGSLAVKLVDYDGMCVPSLTMLKTIEVGHPNFQHPQRARDGIYSLEVDRFSHLVIYTAVRALQTGGKGLWAKYDNGDNLLFKQVDFDKPGQSALFKELLAFPEPGVRILAQQIGATLSKPLDQTPPLEELAPKLPATKTGAKTTTGLKTTTGVKSGPAKAEDMFAEATSGSAGGKRPAKKSPMPLMLAAAGVLGALALAVGGAVYVMSRSEPKIEERVAQKSPEEPKKNSPPPMIEPPNKVPPEKAKRPEPTVDPKPEPPKPELKPEPRPEVKPETKLKIELQAKPKLVEKHELKPPPKLESLRRLTRKFAQIPNGPKAAEWLSKGWKLGDIVGMPGQFKTGTLVYGYAFNHGATNPPSWQAFGLLPNSKEWHRGGSDGGFGPAAPMDGAVYGIWSYDSTTPTFTPISRLAR